MAIRTLDDALDSGKYDEYEKEQFGNTIGLFPELDATRDSGEGATPTPIFPPSTNEKPSKDTDTKNKTPVSLFEPTIDWKNIEDELESDDGDNRNLTQDEIDDLLDEYKDSKTRCSKSAFNTVSQTKQEYPKSEMREAHRRTYKP